MQSGEEEDCQEVACLFFFLVVSTVPCSTPMINEEVQHLREPVQEKPRIDQVRRRIVRTVACLFFVAGEEYTPLAPH